MVIKMELIQNEKYLKLNESGDFILDHFRSQEENQIAINVVLPLSTKNEIVHRML